MLVFGGKQSKKGGKAAEAKARIGALTPLSAETTFILSFVTKDNGYVLLYRERVAGHQSNSVTFANLHTHPPMLCGNHPSMDNLLMGELNQPSNEQVSARSLEEASGLKLGRDIKLKRASKRIKWKMENSFVQSFHYVLLFEPEGDPIRQRDLLGPGHAFLPLGSVVKAAENPLVRAGLRLVFVPFALSQALDQLATEVSMPESKAVMLALHALRHLSELKINQRQSQPQATSLIEWPFDLPSRPDRSAPPTLVRKWLHDCHLVRKKNSLFYFINVLVYHLVRSRPTSTTLAYWLAEVVEGIDGAVSDPECDAPSLEMVTLNSIRGVLEKYQLSMHAICKNTAKFLVNGIQSRLMEPDNNGQESNSIIVLHSLTTPLVRVAMDLVRNTVSSAGPFDGDALPWVHFVLGEGRPSLDGFGLCRKLFDVIKQEKERMGQVFGSRPESPGAAYYGLDESYLEDTATQRVNLTCTTDGSLPTFLQHAQLAGHRPIVLIGAKGVHESGSALCDSGALALASVARQLGLTIILMVQADTVGVPIPSDLFEATYPRNQMLNGWAARPEHTQLVNEFIRQSTIEMPVFTAQVFKHDMVPPDCVTVHLTEMGQTSQEQLADMIKHRGERLARLELG